MSKLSPPPPPPPALPPQETLTDEGTLEKPLKVEYRQEGKIFVKNLPLWIKKNDVAKFLKQFGPIKNVIIIRSHGDIQQNKGFGFVIYDGSVAARSAMKAVEFDRVEFHRRVLTVKLDDGRIMRAKAEERAMWVEGGEDGVVEYMWCCTVVAGGGVVRRLISRW
ncbi:hypothetical protein RJ640_027587 [Escallonia rubra]|uniref:RRM domain-containing protein n=1 Tax=Escallonia rubra TaxID=112253 RepID=A0AA88U3T8_9ASTE|nr:hypothetical protein RJ640_027587 [Escallonia rubra]